MTRSCTRVRGATPGRVSRVAIARRKLACAVVLAVVSAAGTGIGGWGVSPAHAQREEGRARVLFERAVALLEAGDFAAARDGFNQSLALAPNAGTAFNLCIAYRGTGELLRARGLLEALLAGEHGRLDGAQRSEVTSLLGRTRAELATLRVTMTGAARATLRVDGRITGELSEGTPLDVPADPGERLIVVDATDREPHEQTARLTRGRSTAIAIALRPTAEALVGTLVLEAPSADDTVEIVGVARGQGHLERVLAPGRYEVRVTTAHGSRSRPVDVRARSTTRLALDVPRSRSLPEEPAFWVTTVGVAVAATVTVFLATSGSRRRDAISDPEFGVTTALEARP